MPTVGSLLDGVLDQVSQAMNRLADRMDSLESRIVALESEGTPSQDEPVVDVPAVDDSILGDPEETPVNLYLLSDHPAHIIEDLHGVTVMLDIPSYHVDFVRCSGLTVRSAQSPVGKVRAFDCSNLHFERVVSNGVDGSEWEGTAFSIHGCDDVLFTDCSAQISRYGLWCDNSSQVCLEGCSFTTEGIESCVRFVSCHYCEVKDSYLTSGQKHCFRVHGISSGIELVRTTLNGGNGIMMGTMSGDEVVDICIDDCVVSVTGPDGFNIANFLDVSVRNCEFALRQSWDPFESYRGNPEFSFTDSVLSLGV